MSVDVRVHDIPYPLDGVTVSVRWTPITLGPRRTLVLRGPAGLVIASLRRTSVQPGLSFPMFGVGRCGQIMRRRRFRWERDHVRSRHCVLLITCYWSVRLIVPRRIFCRVGLCTWLYVIKVPTNRSAS